MNTIGKLLSSILASAALCLGSYATAHAQASKSDKGSSSAGAKTERQQPKATDQQEHRALSKAHQTAINQAQAVVDYADKNKSDIDKAVLNRYTESIGRALDDAQQRRQALEANVPKDSSAAGQFQTVRDHEQSAAEHYRSLVQEAAKTAPEADTLKGQAKDIVSELKDAEAAHKKTFSGSSSAKESGSTSTRNPSSNPGSSSSSQSRSSY